MLGATNYSHWRQEAAGLRQCLWQRPETQAPLLATAAARLATFWHVGLTDMLSESVTSLSVRRAGCRLHRGFFLLLAPCTGACWCPLQPGGVAAVCTFDAS